MIKRVMLDTIVNGTPLSKFPELCTVFDRLTEKVDPKTLEPMEEPDPFYSFEGKNYVIFGHAALDKDGTYSALTLRLGDRIKKDGTAPVHKIFWKIREHVDFLSKSACDWKHPISVKENVNYIKVETPERGR